MSLDTAFEANIQQRLEMAFLKQHQASHSHYYDLVSRGEGELAQFQELIRGVDTVNFFKSYWERRPFVLRGVNFLCDGVFSKDQVSKFLNNAEAGGGGPVRFWGREANAVVYQNGAKVPVHKEGTPTSATVGWQLYEKAHATLQLVQPQQSVPGLAYICSRLEDELSCLVGTNAYITPPNAQGLAPHHDDIDAWIVQVEGTKKWRVWAPVDAGGSEIGELPQHASGDLVKDPSVGCEVTLNRGDVMYLPRGWVHCAWTESVGSMHITISAFHRLAWVDFLKIGLPMALDLCTREDRRFRQSLPPAMIKEIGTAFQFAETPNITPRSRPTSSVYKSEQNGSNTAPVKRQHEECNDSEGGGRAKRRRTDETQSAEKVDQGSLDCVYEYVDTMVSSLVSEVCAALEKRSLISEAVDVIALDGVVNRLLPSALLSTALNTDDRPQLESNDSDEGKFKEGKQMALKIMGQKDVRESGAAVVVDDETRVQLQPSSRVRIVVVRRARNPILLETLVDFQKMHEQMDMMNDEESEEEDESEEGSDKESTGEELGKSEEVTDSDESDDEIGAADDQGSQIYIYHCLGNVPSQHMIRQVPPRPSVILPDQFERPIKTLIALSRCSDSVRLGDLGFDSPTSRRVFIGVMSGCGVLNIIS